MKKIIPIILLIVGVNCSGQKKDADSVILKVVGSGSELLVLDSNFWKTAWAIPSDRHSNFYITPKQDTIRVLMLVCDTSGSAVSTIKYFSNCAQASNDERCVWWQSGYGIRPNIDGIVISFYDGLFSFTDYLDQNKKPLPKSVVVWMSKEIKN